MKVDQLKDHSKTPTHFYFWVVPKLSTELLNGEKYIGCQLDTGSGLARSKEHMLQIVVDLYTANGINMKPSAIFIYELTPQDEEDILFATMNRATEGLK